MKKFLPFVLLSFFYSFLFAQNPEQMDQNAKNTGLAQSVLYPFTAGGSAGNWIDSKNESGTCLQKLIQVAGKIKETAVSGDVVYLPDTVIERSVYSFFDSTRYIFTYNSMGLFSRGTIEKSGIGSNGEWVNNELDTCTYDAKGSMLSVVIRVWASGAWANSSLAKYTYDGNGLVLTESEATWLNDQWTNTYRNTYTYDASGNKLTAMAEHWLNNQWTNVTRYTWTYDAQGNNLTYLYEQWMNEKWVNSLRFTKTFNAKGDNLATLNENWTNGQWMNTLLDSCTFDAKGNRLSVYIRGWMMNHWKDSLLENLTYNGNGKMLTDTTYTYANGLTKVFMENIFSYDANGNCISNYTQGFFHDNWNYAHLIWCTLTDTCTYDASCRLLDDLRSQLGVDGVYYPKRRYTYTYDALGNMLTISYKGKGDEWHAYDKYVLINASNYLYFVYDFPYAVDTVHLNFSYFTMMITGVPDPPNALTAGSTLLQNYPNPFTSATTINYKVTEPGFVSLKVFDVTGNDVVSLVNEQKSVGDYSSDWNASGYPGGIYFCRLQYGKFSEAKRMLLLK